jgi:flagellar hook-basal body complex protein FliE
MSNTIPSGGGLNWSAGLSDIRPANNAGVGASFSDSLKEAVDQVEQLHTDAQSQVKDLLQGDRDDVHNVMIAVEKADVAFQLMMQVRNKIVNAYEEISRMQF